MNYVSEYVEEKTKDLTTQQFVFDNYAQKSHRHDESDLPALDLRLIKITDLRAKLFINHQFPKGQYYANDIP